MNAYTEKIRELASNLLREGKVDLVIGFKPGTVPMSTMPAIARTPEQANDFVWDSNCSLNLANYLTNRKEKIGIIAKGCDSRNIVNNIVENKISRDQLYIIGVPCTGMVDKKSIRELFDLEITEFKEDGATLLVKTLENELKIDRQDYLRDNCVTCMHRNPVIHDVLVGEPVVEQLLEDPFKDVKAIEAMDADGRWNHFENLLDGCIRCYACRNACPLCYCPTCFVDESNPQWVGKGQDPTDVRTFHFLRAYHCAGRCTDCGACEQACPMDIKVRTFTRKLVKDSLEIYGWEAGLTLDQRPPLDTFKPGDPDTFIK
ncbi:MAG: 4Fe-4S dicluster domain-containing protein [Desulfobacterium sp.]|jgi:ferredoxin|nr:4Fe-4S dicluster domain-containing protein [Desulfobacterium sp.]